MVDQDVVASLEAEAARLSEAWWRRRATAARCCPMDELAEAEAVLDAEAESWHRPGVGGRG